MKIRTKLLISAVVGIFLTLVLGIAFFFVLKHPEIRTNQEVIIFLSGLIITAFIFFIINAISLCKAIDQSLSVFLKSIDAIKKGVMVEKVNIKTKDEFGKLAEAFNDMISKLKEIDKAKTEFVSLATHQLRTPLAMVSWYTEMLLLGDMGSMNEDQKRYLEKIYAGNKRMVDLVNALLNISRLELGTFRVESEITDIVKFAEGVIDEQRQQIKDKDIDFQFHSSPDIPLLKVDRKLLQIIFQNVLSNSIRYTPQKGKIMISFSIDKENKNVLIKISDSGCGIPKNQQNKIFTRLFRADNAVERDPDGTGLGLYLVNLIMGHTGGKVWFESPSLNPDEVVFTAENPGTVFYISLPLKGMNKKIGTKILS